jgi:outer membrane protein OmpA-like peptidoglycan-associated protein
MTHIMNNTLFVLGGTTLLVVGVVAGCATPPKPRELEALERLRRDPNLEAAQKRAPALCEDSDKQFKKARDEWDSSKLEDSRRDALLGSIKLKTALALVEQDQAKARFSAADSDYRKSEEEYARVAKDLSQMNEQIALLTKLGEARTSGEKLSRELGEEQQKAKAHDKISAAQLALKTADTVEASNYAQAEYRAAADMLARAETEFGSGAFAAAETSAELAKGKAEQALIIAKPAYQQAEQTKSNKTRDEALGRDAAGVPGVTVRLERRGEVARLVLPLRDLFTKKQTTIAAGREASLDGVAQLLKKYPTYPVEIVGHTDSRGKHDELVAISLARAQSVLEALVSRGSDSKRFLVSGKGPDEPVTDNKSSSGRAQNSRIEIVFLYQ